MNTKEEVEKKTGSGEQKGSTEPQLLGFSVSSL